MNEETKITIRTYIEKNHDLLEVLAIFVALTIFFQSLNIRPFSVGLSFLSLTAVGILWLEVWETFPNKRGDMRLTLFENVIFLGGLGFIAYWLLEFNDIFGEQGLTIILGLTGTLILLTFISWALKRANLFNRLFQAEPGGKVWLRYIFAAFLFIVCFIISGYVATGAVPPIESFIENNIPIAPNVTYLLRQNSSSSYTFAVENLGDIEIQNLTVAHDSFIYDKQQNQWMGVAGQETSPFQGIGLNWITQAKLEKGEIAQGQFDTSARGNGWISFDVFDITYERSYDSRAYNAQAIFLIDQDKFYTWSEAQGMSIYATATKELPQQISTYANFPIFNTKASSGNDQ